MRIPKSFMTFGLKIVVRCVDQLKGAYDDDWSGYWHNRRNVILLHRPTKDRPIPLDQIEQIFCHELFHALLDKIGRSDLSADEKFVELLSLAYHQAIVTQKGSLEVNKQDEKAM